jgi:hypothetical protein
MKIAEGTSRPLSVPRSTLDVSRRTVPKPGDLRTFARALIELTLQLEHEAEEDSRWTP